MSSDEVDKKILILNATEKMVAKVGFHGLSMQMLAKEAGVAAGTIYRYFENKEELIEETRLHVSQRTAEIIQVGLQDEMSLKEKYRVIWLNIWHFAKTDNAVKSHLLYEQLSSKYDERIYKKEKEMFYKIEQMFEAGKSSGLFKNLDNKVLFSVSLESSATLARKQRNHCFQLDEMAIENAIEASWDAIINH